MKTISLRSFNLSLVIVCIIAVVLPELNPAIAQKGSVTAKVLAIRDVNLKEDADHKAFEAFFHEKYATMVRKCYPGTTTFLMKGERGQEAGNYKSVWVFDSVEQRNMYFPSEGDGEAGSEGLGAAVVEVCAEDFKALQTGWDKYLIPEKEITALVNVGYTDYIQLKPKH